MLKQAALVAVFVATVAAALTLFATFSGGGWSVVIARIATLTLPIWCALAVLTACFYLLDWLRFRSVLAVLGHRLRPIDGLRLTCVSYFATSLTPSSELHTPAMVYMLTRQHVPAAQALAATLAKSIYMTLWICAVAWLSLATDDAVALPAGLRRSLPLLTLPLLVIAVALAWVALFPGAIVGWSERQALRLPPASLRRRLVGFAGDSAAAVAVIGTSRDLHHRLCHVASLAFLLTYVVIGWVLAEQLGFRLSFRHAVTVFSTSMMVEYLAPVPGSIGVTEVATSYLLDPRLTPEGMAVALTLRALCWYLVALPGAWVLYDTLRREGRRGAWRDAFTWRR